MPSSSTELKSVVVFGFSNIPVGGQVLGLLAGFLWPDEDPVDTWESIKDRTEALINSKLDAEAYERVRASLNGIKNNITNYVSHMKAKEQPDHMYGIYAALNDDFIQQVPSFQQPSHKFILLPLFVQLANLHLLFLHDAYDHQKELGIGRGRGRSAQETIKDAIGGYTKYAQDTFAERTGQREAKSSTRPPTSRGR